MRMGSATATRHSPRLIGIDMQEGNKMKITLINTHLNWIVTLTALTLAVVAAAGSAL
jgi:hypothetical protein